MVRADDRIELGRQGEDIAAAFLSARGWTILDRNVRSRAGELDLVCAREGILAFVEVKTRRSARFGSPAEAVTPTKQRRIRALAARYLSERRPGADAVRFDVVDIARDGLGYRVTHVEDAF